MTPCSFLISSAAQRPNNPPSSTHTHNTHISQHSLNPRAFDLERMMEQFKTHRPEEPAKRKNICWGDSRATNSVQSIFALLPAQDLLEMVGNFPFGVALLLFKSGLVFASDEASADCKATPSQQSRSPYLQRSLCSSEKICWSTSGLITHSS